MICHGILLAGDGNKLSKKLRNYTEPSEIFERQGADALRWYLMSTNIVRGGDTRISDTGIDDVVRQVLLPVERVVVLRHVRERRRCAGRLPHRLGRPRPLHPGQDPVPGEAATERMDAYDLPGACAEIGSFIDALNNWYIRRSRIASGRRPPRSTPRSSRTPTTRSTRCSSPCARSRRRSCR